MNELPLGKPTHYSTHYDPALLCAIPRATGRIALGLSTDAGLPFKGVDIWNAYELSWLTPQGKPCVALAEIHVPAESPYMVESKSLKLYLNSFCYTRFNHRGAVLNTLETDLAALLHAPVFVRIILPNEAEHLHTRTALPGLCLDTLDLTIDAYDVSADLLMLEGTQHAVTEILHSHLLRSNCPVTQQPDWASVLVEYTGDKIDHAALLKYIVSYRNHNGFHEQCVEQIFMDIKTRCHPQHLTVYARYTRRGGIDINPYRSDRQIQPANTLSFRQ